MKKRTLLTLVISTLALWLVYKIGAFFLNAMIFSHQSAAGFWHHGGPRGFHHDYSNGIVGQSFIHLYGMVAFMAPILLIVLGFIIWKKAQNNRLKKWVGLSLLAIGLIVLLPKFILIPLTLIVAYMVYKSKKNLDVSDFTYEVNGQVVKTNSDYLDDWEKKVKMEE